MRYYIGCKGWKSQTWSNEFYPITLHSNEYLSYYSKVFDFVEIDLNRRTSSLYKNQDIDTTTKLPNKFSKNGRWQIVQDITRVGDFLEELSTLEKKILTVVIESFTTLGNNGREWLGDILHSCTYHGFSVAFEFKHPSWFQDLTFNILNKHKAAVVWSEFSARYPILLSQLIFFTLGLMEEIMKSGLAKSSKE